MTYLRRLSTLVLEVKPYLIILIWPHLGVFLALFRPFGVFFWIGFGAQNILETCLCRLSILVLELQPYLVFFHSTPFGAFLELFGPLGAIIGVGVSSKKTFLGPTYIP